MTPLFYIVDDDLTLFWLSSKTSSHSINLKRSPRAAISVYRQAESWKDIEGVQMRGSITIVADKRRRSRLDQDVLPAISVGSCLQFGYQPMRSCSPFGRNLPVISITPGCLEQERNSSATFLKSGPSLPRNIHWEITNFASTADHLTIAHFELLHAECCSKRKIL